MLQITRCKQSINNLAEHGFDVIKKQHYTPCEAYSYLETDSGVRQGDRIKLRLVVLFFELSTYGEGGRVPKYPSALLISSGADG